MRAALYADRDHSLVIKRFHACRVLGRRFEERIDDTICRFATALGDNLLEASASKKFTLAISGIEDSVAEEDEHISRLHAEGELVVVGFVE